MLHYKKAGPASIELLTQTRVMVLRAANQLPDTVDMAEVEAQSRAYYEWALADGTHTAYLVLDGEAVVGTGGVSYFQVMPTYHNPTGQKAYLMNLYTAPEYRRRGIALETLRLLVQDAKERGVHAISLEATAMGRPLYEKFGFVKMNGEMKLPSQFKA